MPVNGLAILTIRSADSPWRGICQYFVIDGSSDVLQPYAPGARWTTAQFCCMHRLSSFRPGNVYCEASTSIDGRVDTSNSCRRLSGAHRHAYLLCIQSLSTRSPQLHLQSYHHLWCGCVCCWHHHTCTVDWRYAQPGRMARDLIKPRSIGVCSDVEKGKAGSEHEFSDSLVVSSLCCWQSARSHGQS